jgi:hypothetical protein
MSSNTFAYNLDIGAYKQTLQAGSHDFVVVGDNNFNCHLELLKRPFWPGCGDLHAAMRKIVLVKYALV